MDPDLQMNLARIEDDAFREFIADLNAAATLMRHLRRALALVAGLKAAEYAVLLGVWYCERTGKSSVREIADHLHVAAAHVTDELGKLERAGFVIKRESAVDRRAVDVRLTSKGLESLENLKAAFRDVNLVLFENVSVADMQVVHEFFKRIIDRAPDAVQIAQRHARRRDGS